MQVFHPLNPAYNHIGTYKAGSNAYNFHMKNRFSGIDTVRVLHDSSIYVYDNTHENRYAPIQWRTFIKWAFVTDANGRQYKLTGKFPFYQIETKA